MAVIVRKVTAGVAAACALITASAAWADEHPAAEVMTSVGVKDAKDLLTEGGADAQKVEFGPDSFTITATLSPGRRVWFEGMTCKGAGDAMTCPEFKISTAWQLDTPAHAEALAKALNYNYTSVFADDANLQLWRMDVAYGGITYEHLRFTVLEFLELRQQAEGVIWPSTKSSGHGEPRRK